MSDNELARSRCFVMKMGFVIVEFQDWETHLNRIKDFTGSRVRMSNTTLSGRSSDRDNISVDRDICGWSVWWIIFKAQSKIWGFRILIFALLCLTKNLWLLGLFKRYLHFFFHGIFAFTLIQLGAYLMLYGLSWMVLTLAYVLWLLGVVYGSS